METQIKIVIPWTELQVPAPIVVLDLLHPVISVTNVEVSLETLVREE